MVSELISVSLGLVGIEITLNQQLIALSKTREITLGDIFELGVVSGDIAITARDSRNGRHLLLLMDSKPVFFRDVGKPSVHCTNVFANKSLWLPDFDKYPKKQNLILTVFFGEKSDGNSGFADLKLFDCSEGFGFSSVSVRYLSDGQHVLHLGFPAPCNLGAEVYWTRNGRIDDTLVIEKGAKQVPISEGLANRFNKGMNLTIRFFPLTDFGDPVREYMIEMPFRKKEENNGD